MAEAIIVLDVVSMIAWKSRNITNGMIIVLNDNLELVKMINNDLLLTQFAIEATAKVIEIKQTIQSIVISIKIQWIRRK